MQRDYGIPADAGRGRAVPRLLFRYQGDDKFQFLATLICMTVHGALPELGGKERESRLVTQDEMAAGSGLTRPTFTRRLSRFAPADDRVSPEQRRKLSARMRQVRGGKDSAETSTRRAAPVEMVQRDRQFALPNRYQYLLPRTLEEIRQHPGFAHLWNTEGNKWKHSFKVIPGWLWDPRLPLTDTARVVLTYYFCCGILDKNRGGTIGMVHPRQDLVARSCGISVKQVYLANRELQGIGVDVAGKPWRASKWGVRRGDRWLSWHTTPTAARQAAYKVAGWDGIGAESSSTAVEVAEMPPVCLIRVAHPKPQVRTDSCARTRFQRGPAKILYLPVRQLTAEEARAERDRLQTAILWHTQGRTAGGMMALAQTVHRDLLSAWEGQEHALGTFWKECRKRMASAGVYRSLIEELIPSPPE